MGNFGSEKVDPAMVDAIDFMVERVGNYILIQQQIFNIFKQTVESFELHK